MAGKIIPTDLSDFMPAALLAAVLFAASATTGKRLSGFFANGAQANLYRLIVSGCVLGVWAIASGHGIFGPGWGLLWVSGVIGFGIGDVALFFALRSLGARLTVMIIHCLATPIAGFLEWACLGTEVRPIEAGVTVLILTGVVTSLLGQTSGRSPSGESRISTLPWQGWLWGLLASLGQAGGAVMSRIAYQSIDGAQVDTDAMSVAWIRILGGVCFSFIFLKMSGAPGLLGRWPSADSGMRRRSLIILIILNGILGPAAGVSCYQWALATTPTALVLPVVALSPVLLIPLSMKVDGVRPTAISVLGGIIAIASVVILGIQRS